MVGAIVVLSKLLSASLAVLTHALVLVSLTTLLVHVLSDASAWDHLARLGRFTVTRAVARAFIADAVVMMLSGRFFEAMSHTTLALFAVLSHLLTGDGSGIRRVGVRVGVRVRVRLAVRVGES